MRPSRGSHESTKQRSPSRVPSRTGRQTSVTGSHQAPSSHGAARPHVSPTRAGRRQTPRNSSPSGAQTVPSSHGRWTSGSLSCQRPQASPSPAGAARTKRAHQLGSPGRQKRGSPSTGAQSSSRAHSPATGTQTFRPSTQLDGARRHAWFGAHSRLHAHSSPAATTPRRYRPSQPGNIARVRDDEPEVDDVRALDRSATRLDVVAAEPDERPRHPPRRLHDADLARHTIDLARGPKRAWFVGDAAAVRVGELRERVLSLELRGVVRARARRDHEEEEGHAERKTRALHDGGRVAPGSNPWVENPERFGQDSRTSFTW